MCKQVILCVDDEKIVINSLRTELKKSFGDQYSFEFAESGKDALALFNEMIPEKKEIPLIITDYIMPKMKGDELLKLLQQKLSSKKKNWKK
ncbi:MAG: response regulator [Bacteroidia bacterium]|nr:response regulator [Bacteroidia bacterium]